VYRNQKNQVRHLTKQEYVALKTLCRLSKNLYNATLYAIRQYYFTEKKYLKNTTLEASTYLGVNTELIKVQ